MDNQFHLFGADIDISDLPKRFTFPFYYDPHPLAVRASELLRSKLLTLSVNHNFGLDSEVKGLVIGKMFGVLVARSLDGTLGYFCAFSGKLADSNHHEGFVPPVYDMLHDDGFFRFEEGYLNALTAQISALENGDDFIHCSRNLEEIRTASIEALQKQREVIKRGKQERKKIRSEANSLSPEDRLELESKLVKQSLDDQFAYKRLIKFWREKLEKAQMELDAINTKLSDLKSIRKERSQAVQARLFEQYKFLNANKEWKNLIQIFEGVGEGVPPAGAGECAAPKLLHYAYQHGYEPIAMAEFWWGASPKSEVRKHMQYYPACQGKCGPILSHMLQGLVVDDNPMLSNPAEGKTLEIVHEDEHILVVNKPAEFLSVPGKNIEDSVFTRVKKLLPKATGPLIVHRLDMSTSGLLLLAKTKEVHKKLQSMFLRHLVVKRYIAIVEGQLLQPYGEISLPIRVDLDDRPRQLVDFVHGKPARTKWERIEIKDGRTKVHFYPVSGRTHQLRLHAAHELGLNSPICGDDLYGQKLDRLYLHAEKLTFMHPVTKENMEIEVPPPFSWP